MIDLIPMFYGIPVADIERDVKDGKFILKSQGNINSDVKAQTIIVYGNVTGPIRADQVVIINGDATGNIHANTVTKLESKEKKTCESCKYYTEENCISPLFYCKEKRSGFPKSDIKICEKYQEEKKSCDTCKYHQRLGKYKHFYSCSCDNTVKEIKCGKYQKRENPAKQVSSSDLPTKRQY